MDKKTKTIVIVVLAIVVLGGLYYGYNRWRQERLAMEFLKNMYGVTGGKTPGDLTGKLSGNIAAEIAKQTAKDEAEQKKEEAREAAKTPLDKFNETKEVSLVGKTSSVVKDMVEPKLTAIFGKIKPTLFKSCICSDVTLTEICLVLTETVLVVNFKCLSHYLMMILILEIILLFYFFFRLFSFHVLNSTNLQ